MTDPASALRTAVFAALTSPALLLDSVAVPVVGPVASATQAAPYVVLSSQTATGGQVAESCIAQEVTLLIDVVTAFVGGHVSTAPADAIAAQIVPRLSAAGLVIGTYEVISRQLALSETLTELTSTETVVRRLMRFRYTLFEPVTA